MFVILEKKKEKIQMSEISEMLEEISASRNKISKITDDNELYHSHFSKFFATLESGTLSEKIKDYFYEEQTFQQDMYVKQNSILNDLEQEIRRNESKVEEMKNSTDEDEADTDEEN